MEDFILRVLVVAGIVSIIINMVNDEEDRKTSWIEGFAILLAVVIVVLVTVLNDMKQEKEFIKLNEQAESGKKITIIRDGVKNENLSLEDVLVGDLVILKAGMEIAGDGLVITGFSLKMDESSMTGETKGMNKDTLEKTLEKKENLKRNKGVD